MFRKKKIIKNCPYGSLLNIHDEKKIYNDLCLMKKDSKYKTYNEWSEYILDKWKEDDHINNFVGLKHYLILLKSNAEELNCIPIEIISFIFGGALAGSIAEIKSYLGLIAIIATIIIIEIVMILIKYYSKREICLYSDLIELIDYRIYQIKEQNLVQGADEQCPIPKLTTKKQ